MTPSFSFYRVYALGLEIGKHVHPNEVVFVQRASGRGADALKDSDITGECLKLITR